MVERIDERKGRCAIESSSIVQSCGNSNRRLIDIWDAEIDFPHDEEFPDKFASGVKSVPQSISALGSELKLQRTAQMMFAPLRVYS